MMNLLEDLFMLLKDVPLKPLIIDIGRRRGKQTLELARISKGKIIALDYYQPFLDILLKKAIEEGIANRITLKNQSMLEMDFVRRHSM